MSKISLSLVDKNVTQETVYICYYNYTHIEEHHPYETFNIQTDSVFLWLLYKQRSLGVVKSTPNNYSISTFHLTKPDLSLKLEFEYIHNFMVSYIKRYYFLIITN